MYFSSPEPKAHKVSLKYTSRRLSVCVCASVCVSTLSNMNISQPVANRKKFLVNHHWDWVKAALDFGRDRIRTLVSMATDRSHRVIIGKRL